MPGAWLARAPARSWHSQNSSPSYLWCRKACAHSRQSLTVRVVSRQARSKVRGQDHLISLTPVLHYLPKFSQTHVHWISNTTHPSHSLSPPSPALNLSQHQGLFQWVGSLCQVCKVLELQLQFFQWFPLGLTGLISLLSKGLSRVFSNTTVQMNQFFGTQPSLWSTSHICTWLLEKL